MPLYQPTDEVRAKAAELFRSFPDEEWISLPPFKDPHTVGSSTYMPLVFITEQKEAFYLYGTHGRPMYFTVQLREYEILFDFGGEAEHAFHRIHEVLRRKKTERSGELLASL